MYSFPFPTEGQYYEHIMSYRLPFSSQISRKCILYSIGYLVCLSFSLNVCLTFSLKCVRCIFAPNSAFYFENCYWTATLILKTFSTLLNIYKQVYTCTGMQGETLKIESVDRLWTVIPIRKLAFLNKTCYQTTTIMLKTFLCSFQCKYMYS